MQNELSIAEIAHAAGLSPRAVRYYVQEKLLPPPLGAGRGSHYSPDHLRQLHRIAELQRAGYALDAIRQLLNGQSPPPPPEPPRPARVAPVAATLRTHIDLADGVELAFDTARFSPDPNDLLALRELARKIFRP